MLMKRLAQGAALSVIALSLAVVAHAQETTSAIHGVITNDQGKPLSGVTVVVTDTQTGAASKALTGGGGAYDIRNLPPGGPYLVRAQAGEQAKVRVPQTDDASRAVAQVTARADEGSVVIATRR